jgi:hypothetical protein
MLMARSERSLTEKLRRIKSSLASVPISALTRELLSEIELLARSFPIEFAELRASPKQIRFADAFFSRRHPDTDHQVDIFAAVGGNRSGKSFVTGWLCFAKYLRDLACNDDWFWCVAQTLDRSLGGQQRELWQALPRWMFGDQAWDEKLGFGAHRKLVLPTQDGGKCLIEFRSVDQDASTFEQAKLTGVWVDERLPEPIYDRLLPRIIDRSGWVLYSDIPEQWWQFERLQEAARDAGVFYQHFEMSDNAHNLPDGAIATAEARMTEDEKKLRIKGQYVVMEGVVFKEYIDLYRDQGGHLVRPFVIPTDWPRVRMIDYGGSAPTACPWVAIAPNEHLYVYREHYERGKSVFSNAKLIHTASGATYREVDRDKDELHEHRWMQLTVEGGEQYLQTLIDPGAYAVQPGNKVTLAQQYKDAGIPCVPWPRTNEMGEHALVQKVKYRLENFTIWVFDTCVNMRREMRSWKHKLDKDGKPLAADAYENTNNHLIDGIKGLCGTNPTFRHTKVMVTGGE